MTVPHIYSATVLRWVDGDTVDLRVDLGFYVWHEGRFRLIGVNTPERGVEGWAEATAFAASRAPSGSSVTVQTTKADKYGRFLAEVFVAQQSINVALLDNGHAVPYMT